MGFECAARFCVGSCGLLMAWQEEGGNAGWSHPGWVQAGPSGVPILKGLVSLCNSWVPCREFLQNVCISCSSANFCPKLSLFQEEFSLS